MMARAVVRTHMPRGEAWHETRSMFYKLDRHVHHGPDFRWNKDLFMYYKDLEKSYLPGRMGDAIGLLELDRLGYTFFAHGEDVQIPKVKKVKSAPPVTVNKSRPDYVCFRPNLKDAVLLECKGSFSKTVAALETKVDVGLITQVGAWLGKPLQISATASVPLKEGYAIGTLVDSSSNLLIVKHASTPTVTGASLSVDLIAIHYARWLRIMSIPVIPNALLGTREARSELVSTW
jgi:hypothetical protein